MNDYKTTDLYTAAYIHIYYPEDFVGVEKVMRQGKSQTYWVFRNKEKQEELILQLDTSEELVDKIISIFIQNIKSLKSATK